MATRNSQVIWSVPVPAQSGGATPQPCPRGASSSTRYRIVPLLGPLPNALYELLHVAVNPLQAGGSKTPMLLDMCASPVCWTAAVHVVEPLKLHRGYSSTLTRPWERSTWIAQRVMPSP